MRESRESQRREAIVRWRPEGDVFSSVMSHDMSSFFCEHKRLGSYQAQAHAPFDGKASSSYKSFELRKCRVEMSVTQTPLFSAVQFAMRKNTHTFLVGREKKGCCCWNRVLNFFPKKNSTRRDLIFTHQPPWSFHSQRDFYTQQLPLWEEKKRKKKKKKEENFSLRVVFSFFLFA